MSYHKLTPIIAEGATEPRYLEDRFTDIVSVKDFGAKGDGLTDDTEAFQTGINSITNGILLVPEGLYLISSGLKMRSDVLLLGAGSSKSKIKITEAMPYVFLFGDYTNDTSISNSGIMNLDIDAQELVNPDFSINGSSAKSSAVVYVWNYCNNIVIKNNKIHNSHCTLLSTEYQSNYLEIENNIFSGLQGDVSKGTQWANLINIDSCQAAHIKGNYFANLVKPEGVTGNDWGYAIRLHACDVCIVEENIITSGRTGIFVDGRNSLITENNISNVVTGIHFARNEYLCSGNIALNNQIHDIATGISCTSSTENSFINNNSIICNTIKNYSNVCISDSSGTANIYGNIAYDSSNQPIDIKDTETIVNLKADQIINGTKTFLKKIRVKTTDTDANIDLCSPYLKKGQTDEEDRLSNILFLDKTGSTGTGARFGVVQSIVASSGTVSLRLQAFKNEANSSENAQALLSYTRLGNREFAAPDVIPLETNTYSLGYDSKRWSTIYTQTSNIGTSDEREKTDICDISQEFLEAWGEVRFKFFKFIDSVNKKGEDARLHCGVIAQDISRIFDKHGIDITKYGLFCYDSWQAEEAVLNEDGTIAVPAKESGDIYGIRYDEALAVECAYQRWRLEQLEERINQLTNNNN